MQRGLLPSDWKPVPTIGPGVIEIRIKTELQHRVFYVARFEEAVYVLALPQAVEIPPYQFVTLDWTPEGHPPPDVYDVRHFDLHFYMISEEEREGIDGSTGGQDPQAQFVPQGYVSTQTIVPM